MKPGTAALWLRGLSSSLRPEFSFFTVSYCGEDYKGHMPFVSAHEALRDSLVLFYYYTNSLDLSFPVCEVGTIRPN